MEKMIVFSLNQELYALSVLVVKEIVKSTELNPIPGSEEYFEGVMNLRGSVVPVINLEKRFNLQVEHVAEKQHIIILDINGTLFGMLVDDVSEVLTVAPETIQPVSETLAKKIDLDLLTGIILDKERIILCLNANRLFVNKHEAIVQKPEDMQPNL